jgi:ubiquinone/menaquinone biosynthesis C-methylase UbiE
MGDTFDSGTVVNGRRHEDVQHLSFADASLDVVITSEVFEHVADPWRAFYEVRRVLRRGGRHLFTVPYVAGKPTQSRSGLRPVYHVDPRRSEGIAVVTDFGDDLPLLLKEYSFTTEVVPFPPQQPVGRVYISTAV